ncbi:hypothetical protein LXL04_001117 [Taraxacum kok-saghyz]
MAMVRALVNERPVVIFSKSSCCMCYTIKKLISSFGANPTVYELDEHPEGKQIEKELKGLECKPSVPAVFIGEELIGGANEIMSLHLKGQLGAKISDIEDLSVNVYVTNFPTSMTTMDLRRLCERHGKVLDVYIAQKLSKIGKRFAFVRFLKSKDLKHVHVVEELRRVWVGSYHLFATWARLNKDDAKEQKPTKAATNNSKTQERTNVITSTNHVKVSAEGGIKSYTSVIRNNSGNNSRSTHEEEVVNHNRPTKVFNLLEQDLLVVPDSSTIVLGKTKIPQRRKDSAEKTIRETLLKLRNGKLVIKPKNSADILDHLICSEFRLEYLEWVYRGEASLTTSSGTIHNEEEELFHHDMNGRRNGSQVIQDKNEGYHGRINQVQNWYKKGNMRIIDRMKIFEECIDDDEDEPAGIGRIAIQTTQVERIEEEVEVHVQGITYKVRAREVGNWIPNMEHVGKTEETEEESSESSDDDMAEVVSEQEEGELNQYEELIEETFTGRGNTKEEAATQKKSTKWGDMVDETETTKPIEIGVHSAPPLRNNLRVYSSRKKSMKEKKNLHTAASGNLRKEMEKLLKVSEILGISFLGIQETRRTSNDLFVLRSLWGNFAFDFTVSLARGRSGGIVSMWDPAAFVKESFMCMDNAVFVYGEWVFFSKFKCYMVNVYVPQEENKKRELWLSIQLFMNNNPGNYIIFGDFNVLKLSGALKETKTRSIIMLSSTKKRNQTAIRGIKVEGEWVTGPNQVKKVFFDHSSNNFKKTPASVVVNKIPYIKALTEDQKVGLESLPTLEEVKKVVWCCGSPDGFSFGFIKQYWDLVKEYVFACVMEFFQKRRLPSGCNSSFITLIPKNSSPVVVNDFRPISLIGIQFKVIAKVLVLRLASVIDGIVSSEQSAFVKDRQILDGSLIVNEIVDWYKHKKKMMMILKIDFEKAYNSDNAPTISVARICRSYNKDVAQAQLSTQSKEGLHVAVEDAKNANLFSGVRVGNGDIRLSHLFYADNVVFLAEWTHDNIENIVAVLHCFYLVSGLKLNLHKSNLYGVGVALQEAEHLARIVGCKAEKIPFMYLGLPVGQNMTRKLGWQVIMERFQKRLSRWKVTTLSIGGRPTLLKSVLGALGIYYMSLFLLPVCVAKQLEMLRAKFFSGGDEVKRKIHWIKWKNVLIEKDLKPWKRRLKMINIIKGEELQQLKAMEETIKDVILGDQPDTWSWEVGGDGSFTVRSNLIIYETATRWNRLIPRKVNIMIWRANRDRLPNRLNLHQKGIETLSVLCPICGNYPETLDHLFLKCEVASSTWGEMLRWLELDQHHANTMQDVFDWVDNLVINTRKKEVVDAVVCSLKWYIWKFRNDMIFSQKMKRSEIVEAIKDYFFLWVTNRNKGKLPIMVT